MSTTILVTGATDGIGRQTALELARLGHRVWVHGRSAAKAEAVATELRRASGNGDVDVVAGDFASLRQVRAMADDVNERVERLDVLINNAGVLSPSPHNCTSAQARPLANRQRPERGRKDIGASRHRAGT
jgi:NAD(P)-dependent dehydrogenase (short-subunit alcohol dehydrogenase family)